MDDESVFTKRFIDSVKKLHSERSEEDLDFICHTLKKFTEFRDYSPAKLMSVPERLEYEEYEKDHILYRTNDEAGAWYYVISGSVMIAMNYLFQTECSFGRCINSDVRTDQCHVLESTALLKICYSAEELKNFAQKAAARVSKSQLAAQEDLQMMNIHNGVTSSHGSSTKAENTATSVQNHSCCDRPSLANIEGVILKSNSISSSDVVLRRKPTTSPGSPTGWVSSFNDKVSKEYPQSADFLERNRRSRSEERIVFAFGPEEVKSFSNELLTDKGSGGRQQRPMSSTDLLLNRGLAGKDWRYSAPSGADRKRNRDSMGSIDYLSDAGDSDDEESVQSESSSAASMDAVLEVLSKQPSERTPEDVDRVMDVLQYMPVFSNMTSNIRRALFEVIMVLTFDNENLLVIENGEDVDKWYVVLNGQFKQIRDSSDVKVYSIGDSFGVSQSMKVLPFLGKLVSAEKTCTLGYVHKDDYSRILTQGEENLQKVYNEDGVLEAVFEKRSMDRKESYFLIQGTPEKILDELMTTGTMDETFVKDFLLTYRTFLKSPSPIVERLRSEWEDEAQRNRVSVVVLSWASEHYSDFETVPDMEDFLDWFEQRLLEDGRLEDKSELDRSRTSHSRTRNVELDRAGTNSPLHFEVVGGVEVGQPIFVHKVQTDSIPEKAGLRVGDQILQINDSKVDKKELKAVNSILRKNYKLSLVVRSNLPGYRAFIADPPKAIPEKTKTPRPPPLMGQHAPLSLMHSMDSHTMSVALESEGKGRGSGAHKGTDSPKSKKKTPKIIMPLHVLGKSMKKIRAGSGRSSSTASLGTNGKDGTGPLKAKSKMSVRKASVENLLENDKPAAPVRASSMEDIHSISKQGSSSPSRGGKGGGGGVAGGGLAGKIVDAVVKLYQPDHSYKYIDITPSTTIAELIQQGIKEFYPDKFVVTPSNEYCICMVTITSRNGPIRNSVLPNHMADLANYIGIESRYYLKERAFHGTLVQDEEAEHIFKESRQHESLLNLKPKQIAEELTHQDSIVFCSIQASEYIADLWRSADPEAKKNLQQFENIPNDEMYWVVTMVVSETRSEVRAKIIKHFIKVAKWSKEMKNFNTVFHLISGLNHGLVQRLRSTWEKVPHKHKKVLEDLASFMTPFHNMAKYRELLRTTSPPLIPFFPITKKDLTFLYDGNETQVGGLVNFEKLRMLSQQIRVIMGYCQQPILPMPPQIDVNRLGGVLKTIHHSIRMRNRHTANAMATLTDNALKEVYHHHRMMKMVRKYLSQKYVVQEEDLLERIAESSERVVQMRKNPPSPLHRGKRKSGPPQDKHRALNMTYSISPSSTTASFGSGQQPQNSSAPFTDANTLSTPPASPRKLSAPSCLSSSLTTESSVGSSDKSPELTGNGSVQVS